MKNKPIDPETAAFLFLARQGVQLSVFSITIQEPWIKDLKKAFAAFEKKNPTLNPIPFPDFERVWIEKTKKDTFRFYSGRWGPQGIAMNFITKNNKKIDTEVHGKTIPELKKNLEQAFKKYKFYVSSWNVVIEYNDNKNSFTWRPARPSE